MMKPDATLNEVQFFARQRDPLEDEEVIYNFPEFVRPMKRSLSSSTSRCSAVKQNSGNADIRSTVFSSLFTLVVKLAMRAHH